MSGGTVLQIAGSRKWNVTFDEIEAAMAKVGLELPDVGEVVSGAATGADMSGENWAKAHGIPVTAFRPDYTKYGRRAPLKRNADMAEYLHSHKTRSPVALLFWDGESRGTRHMISELEITKTKFRVFSKAELALAISGAC